MNEQTLTWLYSLEESLLGYWVSTSIWGYPIFLTLHTIGMGTLVGLSLMYSLNVVIARSHFTQVNLLPYWKLALFGLLLNLVSGTALFIGSASSLWFSWPFRIKLMLIFLGVVLSISLVRQTASGSFSSLQRMKAIVVILVWLMALVAGRLIAYID